MSVLRGFAFRLPCGIVHRRCSSSAESAPSSSKAAPISFLIRGFMKFSARYDLISFLDRLQLAPVKVDSILDHRHTPTGQWVLSFDSSVLDSAPATDLDLSSGEVVGAALLPRSSGSAHLPEGIQIRKLAESERTRLVLTSSLNITDRSICLHTLPPYFQPDHVRQLFDGYDIAFPPFGLGIRPLNSRRGTGPTCSYLVDFITSNAAERACREKSATIHDGAVMRITWYNV
jgi:hypothetical protein